MLVSQKKGILNNGLVKNISWGLGWQQQIKARAQSVQDSFYTHVYHKILLYSAALSWSFQKTKNKTSAK